MSQDRYAWLQTVKEGDKVIITSSYGCYQDNVGVVERVTPTQILVKSGMATERYRKTDGHRLGNSQSYNRLRLVRATPAMLATVYLEHAGQKILNRCKNVNRDDIKNLTLAQCEQIEAFLDAYGL